MKGQIEASEFSCLLSFFVFNKRNSLKEVWESPCWQPIALSLVLSPSLSPLLPLCDQKSHGDSLLSSQSYRGNFSQKLPLRLRSSAAFPKAFHSYPLETGLHSLYSPSKKKKKKREREKEWKREGKSPYTFGYAL